jgi:hypothetical protein
MLRFRDLLQFPPFYAKRNKNIREVEIIISNIDRQEEYIEITGSSKNYSPIIRIYGTIEPNSSVVTSCTCESFNFEFSHALFRIQSLLNPQNFPNLLKKPLEKNKYLIPSGCKHIIALSNLILKEKNRII